MSKIDPKAIIERVTEKHAKVDRKNVTFRLNSKVFGAFEKRCKLKKVKMVHVLEELMIEFSGPGT